MIVPFSSRSWWYSADTDHTLGQTHNSQLVADLETLHAAHRAPAERPDDGEELGDHHPGAAPGEDLGGAGRRGGRLQRDSPTWLRWDNLMLEYSDISVYNIRLYFVWFTSKKYLILNLEALHHLHFITFISEYWDEPNNQDSIVMIILFGWAGRLITEFDLPISCCRVHILASADSHWVWGSEFLQEEWRWGWAQWLQCGSFKLHVSRW